MGILAHRRLLVAIRDGGAIRVCKYTTSTARQRDMDMVRLVQWSLLGTNCLCMMLRQQSDTPRTKGSFVGHETVIIRDRRCKRKNTSYDVLEAPS